MKKIILTGTWQSKPLFQIISSIPEFFRNFQVIHFIDDSFSKVLEDITQENRSEIACVIEQTNPYYPSFDRTVANGEWLWITYPQMQMKSLWPLWYGDLRQPHFEAVYYGSRYHFQDFIAAEIAAELEFEKNLLEDDSIFSLYLERSTAFLKSCNLSVESDHNSMIKMDLRSDIMLSDYIINNFQRKILFNRTDSPSGHMYEYLAKNIIYSLGSRLMLNTSKCIDEITYLLTGYEGLSDMQAPIHPYVAKNFELKWINDNTKYRNNNYEWSFKQYILNYIRWLPWIA
jgi:hypothetical protein